MSTKTYYFDGRVRWLKKDKKYNRWTCDLHLDEPSIEKFKKSGCQLELRTHKDDGTTFIKVSRPFVKLIKGEKVDMKQPEFIDVEGNDVDMGIIGNDSEVTVKVNIYDTMKGKGTDWTAMRVNKLNKFERPKIEVDETEESPF